MPLVAAAEEHGFAVVTNDLNLYIALLKAGIQAINFTHVREHSWNE